MIFFLNRSEFSQDYKTFGGFMKFLFPEKIKGIKSFVYIAYGWYTVSVYHACFILSLGLEKWWAAGDPYSLEFDPF